jgi:hypothetical protein
MDEGDEMTAETGAGLGVDDLRAAGGELVHRGRDVADGNADVMHAGAASREEATDVCVVAKRSDQLDPAVSEA